MRQYSWLLAILGGFAVLSFLAYASFAETIGTPWAVTGGVGGALILAWIWIDREAIGASASTRGARFTMTTVSMTVLGLAIAVAFNVLAERYDKRWDVTASQKFTLAAQTRSVVEGLTEDVDVLGFFRAGSEEQTRFEDLVRGYEDLSPHVKVRFVDPLKEPLLAEQNGITHDYGTVVLKQGEDKQRLENDMGEEALTNALVRLTSGKQHEVCFTEGHGEIDPDDDGTAAGMGGVVVKLEGQNYKVEKVNLMREGAVPAHCEILVAADPRVDWLPPEREMLAAWVAGGGRFLLMLDPGLHPTEDPMHAPGLAADMARYGIKVGSDVVLEQNPNYLLASGDLTYVVLDASSFDHHPITEPIKGAVLLRVVRSVDKQADTVDGINVQVLARTTEQAWAETALDGVTSPYPDVGADIVGKVPLMAVAEITDPSVIAVGPTSMPAEAAGAGSLLPKAEGEPAPAPTPEVTRKAGGKVVVVGDTDFASNALLDQLSNKDLFLNTISWLAGEEDQISIRPNAAAQGTLSMTLGQAVIMWLASVLFVPGLAVVGAIFTWWRRRSQ